MIEALYWLNSGVGGEGGEVRVFSSSSKVMITVDSLYVKGLIDEKFVATEQCHCDVSLPFVERGKGKSEFGHPLGTGTLW